MPLTLDAIMPPVTQLAAADFHAGIPVIESIQDWEKLAKQDTPNSQKSGPIRAGFWKSGIVQNPLDYANLRSQKRKSRYNARRFLNREKRLGLAV